MYKSGYDYDYQYDWVLKKSGQKINEEDYVGNATKGNIAAAQGKDDEKKQNEEKSKQQGKEPRMKHGEQPVVKEQKPKELPKSKSKAMTSGG